MTLLAGVSFLGALLEAFFLVIVTGLGMALVSGVPTVGPFMGHSIAMGSALVLGAFVLVVRVILNLWAVRISARLTAHVTTEQRLIASHAYLGASWDVQEAEPAGRLQELLTTFVNRVTGAVTVLTQAITALLSLIAFLAASVAVDSLSTLAVVGVLSLVGTVLVPLRRGIRRRSGELAISNLAFSNAVAELGALGLEMQTFGVQTRFADRIDALTRQATERQRQVQTLSGAMSPIYISVAYAALLVGIAILGLAGFSNLTAVGAIMLLMLRSLNYGQQLASAWGALAAHAPFLDRLESTVEAYRASTASGGVSVPDAVTPLEARGVDFAYRMDQPTLTGVNFQIEAGEIIGVVGPSGAGKSTLAQLVLGLRDPKRGAVLACGVDLRKVDRAWWSSRVAFVAQDAKLFTGTLAENLRFFRDGIDNETLRRAAHQANILTEIGALPLGFDTHLGERGGALSGGQRQRLSIARALAGDPEIIVLDEPTSALDGISERLIRDTLAALKGQVTVIIIAHRMSTLDICDRIMVIERGRMTAFDSPDALRRDSGFYQNAMATAGIMPDQRA
ncbi:ABC transporter ATP-binding protein [Intrasporangium calvum]|nr:ABC transporter ATP-binding protein [Intrasporangium calvum]